MIISDTDVPLNAKSIKGGGPIKESKSVRETVKIGECCRSYT